MLLKSKILVAAAVVSVCASAAMAEGTYMGARADYSFKSNLKEKFSNGEIQRVKDAWAGLGLKGGL